MGQNNDKEFVKLGQAKTKNQTKNGCWVECTIYPSEEKKDIFFPYATKKGDEMIRVVADDEIWVWEWLLEKKEEDLPSGEGILVE